jgi:hypothetical protein
MPRSAPLVSWSRHMVWSVRCWTSDVIGLDGLDLALYPIHPIRSRAPIQQIQWKSNTEIGNNLEMHCIERVTHYHGHL